MPEVPPCNEERPQELVNARPLLSLRWIAISLMLIGIGGSQQDDPAELSYAKNSSAESSAPANSKKVVAPEFDTKLHENADYGFSIHLPTGWGPISKDALAAQGAAVSGPKLRIDYIAGYQVLSNDLFVHPFISVRQLPEDIMPKEKIKSARRVFQSSGDEIVRHVEENANLQLNADVGVPVLEEETGILWLKFQLDGVDGQRIEGLMAHYYVDGKILQFNAGTTTIRGKEDWPVLESILRTIKIHSQ